MRRDDKKCKKRGWQDGTHWRLTEGMSRYEKVRQEWVLSVNINHLGKWTDTTIPQALEFYYFKLKVQKTQILFCDRCSRSSIKMKIKKDPYVGLIFTNNTFYSCLGLLSWLTEVCIYVYISVYICICIFAIYVYMYMYVCILYVYAFKHIYTHIHMYIYIYTHFSQSAEKATKWLKCVICKD